MKEKTAENFVFASVIIFCIVAFVIFSLLFHLFITDGLSSFFYLLEGKTVLPQIFHWEGRKIVCVLMALMLGVSVILFTIGMRGLILNKGVTIKED